MSEMSVGKNSNQVLLCGRPCHYRMYCMEYRRVQVQVAERRGLSQNGMLASVHDEGSTEELSLTGPFGEGA